MIAKFLCSTVPFTGSEYMTKTISEFNEKSIPLLLGCVIGMILGVPIFLIYGTPAFVIPLSEALDAGRGEVSGAINFGILGNLVAAPLVGKLSDKYGSRKMILLGVIFLSITLALFSLAQNIFHLMIISLTMVFFAAGTGPMTYTKIISAWFNRQRGLVLGLALAGMGIGAMIIPVLNQYLITQYGWRAAYQYLGVIVFCVTFLPLYLTLKDNPPRDESQDQSENESEFNEGVSVKEALSSSTFWIIAIGFLFIAVGNSGLLGHLQPILLDAGLTTERAAIYTGAMGFGLVIGRTVAGYLLDLYHAPYVAIAFLAGPFLAYIFFLSGISTEYAIIPIVLFGIGMGAEFDVTPFLISRYFGLKNFSVLFGFQIVTFSLGTGFGPTIMGFGFDIYGTYDVTMISAMVSLAIGCLLISRLRGYRYTAGVH